MSTLITQDLHHHFDASNLNNLSVIGGEVDAWTDEIEGFTVTASSPSVRPAHSATHAVNGINTIYFNGIDSQRLNSSDAWINSPDTTTLPHQYFFTVLKVPHQSSSISATIWDRDGGIAQSLRLADPNSDGINDHLFLFSAGGNITTLFLFPDNEWMVVCVKGRPADDAGAPYPSLAGTLSRINGVTLVDDNSAKITSLDGVTFGSRGNAGPDSDPEFAIAERLFYAKATPLTLSDIEQIEQYLGEKWNVAAYAPELASGTVKFNDAAFSNGVVDWFALPSITTGSLNTMWVEQTGITSGTASMTAERDSAKSYMGIARGFVADFTGSVTAVSGSQITVSSDLTGVNMGGVNHDHYIFKATAGSGSGTEVTIKSRSGNDITVYSSSAFGTNTEYSIGRFVEGISRIYPKG